MLVQIQPIAAYQHTAAIRDFVARVIKAHPAVSGWSRDPAPGRLVVVKPNWIQEAHEFKPDTWEPVITHPEVVLAVIETLAECLGGVGTISVCDAPHTYADFAVIVARGNLAARLEDVKRRWPSLKLEVLDLRREIWVRCEQVIIERRANAHDPRGYVRVNLGADSLFHGHRGQGHYYGADYDVNIVSQHHRAEVQEYLLAGTPMTCDLFVNLPKLKTHKKTGITCCLKNLVGINGDKNWLPHYTLGTPRLGGDEFPDTSLAHELEHYLKRMGQRLAVAVPGLGPWLYRKLRQVGQGVLGDSRRSLRNGDWQGNDTCWRMVLDLNRAFLYGRADSGWREPGRPRDYLAIVDGIVGGEGNGPICPDAVPSGLLLSGMNPAAVDAVACRLMGFDPEDLPMVREAFAPHGWPIADMPLGALRAWDGRLGQEVSLSELMPAIPGGFKPPLGWKELSNSCM